MPEIIDICPRDELPPGAMRLVEWEDLEIGVFNCAGSFYAIEDRCSHDNGTLVEGDHKKFARVKVIERVIDALEHGMERAGLELP